MFQYNIYIYDCNNINCFTLNSPLDQYACGSYQFGQHLLFECYCSVP